MEDAKSWAQEEFGDAGLGDSRLDHRLIRLAARAAAAPSGVVAQVVKLPDERQAAYDLLNNSRVPSASVIDATARATARRCVGARVVRIVIDGTSASLSDQAKRKELGSIGSRRFPTRGLKAVDACAVDEHGVMLGMVGLRTWTRGGARAESSRARRRRDGLTEMAQYWLPALHDAALVVKQQAPEAALWIVGDRECDDSRFLRAAVKLGYFTVRAAQNRIVETERGRRRKLFGVARAGRHFGRKIINVPATGQRAARTAIIDIRVSRMRVLLPLHDNAHSREAVLMNVVELREQGRRGDGLKWTLLTNAPVLTTEQVDEVVASYRARWRIEEFHRTWKAGGCDLEATQLRSREAITKWATILGAVAARVERLKHLSRTQPDAPATIELTETEIVALITAKRKIKNTIEVVPDGIPTIATATLWIADLGGYAGHYKKGRRPGATTISRGLDSLATWTLAVSTLLSPKEIKQRLR
jgi:hypothetical protein